MATGSAARPLLAALLLVFACQLADAQINPYAVGVQQKLPDDNLEGVAMGQDVLTLIMSNRVAAGPGKIRIYRTADNSLRQEIEMTDTSKVRGVTRSVPLYCAAPAVSGPSLQSMFQRPRSVALPYSPPSPFLFSQSTSSSPS